ncbi:MAG: hypothetical protein HZC23_08185 [Rhodocyclales bacterium]|nr:hypothetical protein [Rhodocyclales bacterium]
MPYYLYKVFESPIRRLEKLESHETFKEASTRAKALRRELALSEGCTVKTIFADNELLAEDILSQVREPQPELGDD